MYVTSSPRLWYADGAQKLFAASSTAWSAPVTTPRINGHFEHDTHNNHWVSSGKKSGDQGSDWTLFKSVVEYAGPEIDVRTHTNGVWRGYRGHICVSDGPTIDAPTFQAMITGSSSEGHLMSLGSTAISHVIPTNPIADLPQGVAELFREGLPRVPGMNMAIGRKVTASMLADNYLNYQFAVRPLLRDMRAFADASFRAEQLINDYAARANRKIRRRYEFTPDITTYERLNVVHPTGGVHLAGVGTEVGIKDRFSITVGGKVGTRDDRGSCVKRQWFSGCFTYHLPNAGHDFSSRLAREEAEMRRLYGGISVDTAWNLIPFSWAADWITNAGDVIHNTAAFARDGLVMPYGYIMEQINARMFRTVRGAKVGTLLPQYTNLPGVISTTLNASYKRRRRATPYGFGLLESDFTTRQWAILVALGIKFTQGF